MLEEFKICVLSPLTADIVIFNESSIDISLLLSYNLMDKICVSLEFCFMRTFLISASPKHK